MSAASSLPSYEKGQAVPKVLHYIWMGPAHELFNATNVEQQVLLNQDYEVNIWIDTFSMASPSLLQKIFAGHADLWGAYQNGKKDMLTDPNGKFIQTCQMLLAVRKVWCEYITTEKGVAEAAADQAIAWWIKWAAGLSTKHKKLNLHYLDKELYPHWEGVHPMFKFFIPCDPTVGEEQPEPFQGALPEANLLNMICLELYMRPNYGTASDLVRSQLLIDLPGVYSDHDDKIGALKGKPIDFRYAESQRRMTNSFLAAAKGHPLAYAYRDQVLNNLRKLKEVGYDTNRIGCWDMSSAAELKKRKDPGFYWTLPRSGERGGESLPCMIGKFPPFTLATIIISGPSAFEFVVTDPGVLAAYKIEKGTVAKQTGVETGKDNSWEKAMDKTPTVESKASEQKSAPVSKPAHDESSSANKAVDDKSKHGMNMAGRRSTLEFKAML